MSWRLLGSVFHGGKELCSYHALTLAFALMRERQARGLIDVIDRSGKST